MSDHPRVRGLMKPPTEIVERDTSDEERLQSKTDEVLAKLAALDLGETE